MKIIFGPAPPNLKEQWRLQGYRFGWNQLNATMSFRCWNVGSRAETTVFPSSKSSSTCAGNDAITERAITLQLWSLCWVSGCVESNPLGMEQLGEDHEPQIVVSQPVFPLLWCRPVRFTDCSFCKWQNVLFSCFVSLQRTEWHCCRR